MIDDDPSIREVATLALSTVGGYEVMSAPDGGSGIELVRQTLPDAVLLDVMMPTFDGPAVLSELRRDDRLRDVPVVFLTAKIGARDMSRLDALGAAGVIAKPFDPMTLASEVGHLLGWVS